MICQNYSDGLRRSKPSPTRFTAATSKTYTEEEVLEITELRARRVELLLKGDRKKLRNISLRLYTLTGHHGFWL